MGTQDLRLCNISAEWKMSNVAHITKYVISNIVLKGHLCDVSNKALNYGECTISPEWHL